MDFRTTALYRSMLAAWRAEHPSPDAEPGPDDLVLVSPLEALRYDTLEHLLMALLNRQEARDYAETPEDKRDGPFQPTLPPGYERPDANAWRLDFNSDNARMAREALIAPDTEQRG